MRLENNSDSVFRNMSRRSESEAPQNETPRFDDTTK